ncbi:hypothetical protein UFOVP843_34 [uncultured Caudovirales phage]|uniref:Uncharacterized protein n=1 Tax=uncultured Caudovirales phage TaxID=2100421 RepID=A0A6J5P3X3_9CAUD|nr:hypothetical protein UFOVP843_34 [uncultured Caudovirales phage]CAB4172413.1 hypothetical protein UFOVP936_6 [uncultured Caudovirales phage]
MTVTPIRSGDLAREAHQMATVAETKLDAHVDECGRRYKETSDAMGRVHARIDRIEYIAVTTLLGVLVTLGTTIVNMMMRGH